MGRGTPVNAFYKGPKEGYQRERLTSQQTRLLIGLYIGYCSMMFSRATMDVAIPLILQDKSIGIGPKDIGALLTLCSAFYLVGKLSMGYSVDRIGARFVFLWLASFSSAVLTAMMSVAGRASRMSAIMCAICVAQSSGWAAMTTMVSMWLQASQYAMAFGFLSTSSRMGDLASKLVLGWAVAEGWTWRSLFLVAAVLQFVVAVSNVLLLPSLSIPPKLPPSSSSNMMMASGAGSLAGEGSSASEADNDTQQKTSSTASTEVLWNTLSTERFWCIALGVAALHVIMEFDKYIPLYLHKSLHISPGLAAQGAALYPLSQLLALAVAGYGYERLTALGKMITVSGLCFLVFIFYSLQLTLRAYSFPVVDSTYLVLIFLSGFSVSVPYYLPPSIYLAEVGGRGHCGTLSGMLDASGGVAAMAFHYTVGHLASQDKWVTLLCILCLAALLGFFAMTSFQRMSLPPSRADVLLTPWLRSGASISQHYHMNHLHRKRSSAGGVSSSSSSSNGSSGRVGLISSLQALRWMLLGSVAATPAWKKERKDSTEGHRRPLPSGIGATIADNTV